MNELNPKLLSDLARLAVKYRAKDWEQLAAWLDDEKQRERLRVLVLELGAASRPPRKRRSVRTKRPSPASTVREKLAKMRVDDPGRADLLDDTWLKLRERELLPTIADVRAFAQAMDPRGIQASRRDQAVTELLELLVELPADSFEDKMRQTVVEDRNLGAEYEQWVKLILRSPRGTTQPLEERDKADEAPNVS